MTLIPEPPQPILDYAKPIADATGLSLVTVLAWIRAEGGLSGAGAPGNNFLNLMKPGTQTTESYASPQAGAAAVVKNLRTPRYAAVLATAQATDDPKAELAAIAQSPWDAGHYTGGTPGAPWGTTLYGALKALTTLPDPNKPVKDLIPSPSGWVGDLTGWLQKESAVALAYVVLTVLGLAFVIFGALDTLGYSPARVAGAATRARVPDPIPF